MRTDRLVIIFVVAVMAVVLGFTVATFTNIGKTATKQKPVEVSTLSREDILARLDPGPKPGDKVPDFSVQRIDEKTITLSDYEGKPTVLYFWATWCGSCRTSLEELKKVYPEYQYKINFLAVDLDTEEDLQLVREFVRSHGYVGDFATGNDKIVVDYYALTTSLKFATDEDAILLSKGADTYYADDWRNTFDSMLA